tara:strand:+ start:3786 stop:4586 length:801 start_codon:yes stop_codon:yes gene_type:complete
MRLALPKLIDNNVRFALILNPKVGEIKSAMDVYDELSDILTGNRIWIPALIVTNDYDELSEFIEELQFTNIMIICTDQTDTNDENFKQLISSAKVGSVVSEDNRSLKTFVRNLGKYIIRLDDKFKGVKRNSEYLDMDEEKFTEEHYYYSEDNYDGFSDYTPLVSEFVTGGSAPYAVAIHLTYPKTDEEIWIRHFTSTSNTDRANIQGKFAQAASKAVGFLDEYNIHTNASEELRNYYKEAKYPGLGTSKKISIKHHLEIINDSIKI